jgi:drug/metabolite transporter (DMT)-like permease
MPWPQILWLGLALGGFSMWAQNLAQQHTPAYHAAIIFSLEPIWASLFAHQWGGEPLGPRIWISAAIILAGIAISELWPGMVPSRA